MIIPTHLVDACRKERCIPFIGAGLSAQSGLPLWNSVLAEMRSYLISVADTPDAEADWIDRNGSLQVAHRFKSKVSRPQYHSYLRQWFDPSDVTVSPAHRALAAIPWPFIVTTNFDRLIELAVAQTTGRLIETPYTYRALVMSNAAGRAFLLKLHGSIDDPESVVLTEQDYARSAVEDAKLGHFIQDSLLSFRHVLFVGFSMADPEVRSYVLQSRVITGGVGTSDFVVLTRPPPAEVETWREHGLEIINLDSHAQLAEFFTVLADALKGTHSAAQIGSRDRALPGDILAYFERSIERATQLVELTIRREQEPGAYGRSEYTLPQDLDAFLSERRLAIIFGEAGAGKTTLTAMLAHHLTESGVRTLRTDAAFLAARGLSLGHCIRQLSTAGVRNPITAVILDGLDEVPIATALAILADLRDLWETGGTCVVTSRPLDIGFARDRTVFWLEPLSEQAFLQLADPASGEQSALRDLFNLSPSLHGRPLHALALKECVPGGHAVAPTSEAAYALWYLDRHYTRKGIASETALDLEQVAATLYASHPSLRWSFEQWAEASKCLPNDTARRTALQALVSLTAPDAIFCDEAGLLAPYHRTTYEAMVGRGLARSGEVPGVTLGRYQLDSTSIMLACAIHSMTQDQARTTVANIVSRAPLLAARTLLGAGQRNDIRTLLLDTSFEVDLAAAIKNGRSLLGVAALLEMLEPLFQRDLRNPSLLAEAVGAVERITKDEPSSRHGVRAVALLNRLWNEHRSYHVNIDWVEVPGGYYICGTDHGRDRDEEPSHRIFLSPYRIARYQVTNAQYAVFAPQQTRDRLSQHDSMPVVNVTWAEALLFSRWITGDHGSRLPTEAEWESAARGGTTTRFYWGDEFDPHRANGGEEALGMRAVGEFPPNPYGLYDVAGNVYEWCLDWYSDNYYAAPNFINPSGPETGRYKVMRGGSWGRSIHACSSSYRTRQIPETRDVLVGFRPGWPRQ